MSFHCFKVIKASWSQHRNEHIKHHAKWSKLLTNHSPKSFFTIRVDNKQHQAMTWTTIIHSYHVEVTPYSFSFKKYKWYPMNNNMAPQKNWWFGSVFLLFQEGIVNFHACFWGDVFLRMVVPYVFSMFEINYPWGFWRNFRPKSLQIWRKIHDVKSNDPMKTKIVPHVLIRLGRH